MSDSSSTTLVALNMDVCWSCHYSIHHPCEIFQMTDCPRCAHDVYKCESCKGTGNDRSVLQEDGDYPPCVACNGCGEKRGCATCKGEGSRTIVSRGCTIKCGDCEGLGWKPCEQCNEHRQVKRFVRLCPGDTFSGMERAHRKPPVHPRRDESAKEDWGEAVLPYDPTLSVAKWMREQGFDGARVER